MIKIAILTISDSCFNNKREDLSGQKIHEIISAVHGFEIVGKSIIADEYEDIVSQLKKLSDGESAVDIVLTTGGTGLGPRDVTPEATTSVCEKMAPGIAEIIRAEGAKITLNAVLSRSVAGIRNNTLIINLPGSPKAVQQSLDVIINLLPHAVDMMRGGGH
jgi:molybdenum cofactor synthesis domain-containing protein